MNMKELRKTDKQTDGRTDEGTDGQTYRQKDKHGETHTRFLDLRERAKNFRFLLHITTSWVSYDYVCTQY